MAFPFSNDSVDTIDSVLAAIVSGSDRDPVAPLPKLLPRTSDAPCQYLVPHYERGHIGPANAPCPNLRVVGSCPPGWEVHTRSIASIFYKSS